jgi:hypothetical protein
LRISPGVRIAQKQAVRLARWANKGCVGVP